MEEPPSDTLQTRVAEAGLPPGVGLGQEDPIPIPVQTRAPCPRLGTLPQCLGYSWGPEASSGIPLAGRVCNPKAGLAETQPSWGRPKP